MSSAETQSQREKNLIRRLRRGAFYTDPDLIPHDRHYALGDIDEDMRAAARLIQRLRRNLSRRNKEQT